MAAQNEFDIDLASFLRVLARVWWIIVVLAAVGAIAAAGSTFVQHKTYSAQSSVYLGQPTDANGNAIAGITSNPKAATQIVTSEATLRQVADRVGQGETVGKLRRGLSVQTPTQTVKGISSPINFITITVTDTKPKRAAAAANELADVLISRISAFTQQKIKLLQDQITQDTQQLAATQARSEAAQVALQAIAQSSASKMDKALAAAPYIGIAQSAASQIQPLQDDKRLNSLMLIVAKGVEMPKLLNAAVPPSASSGPSLYLNAAIGLLAGLVVGIVVALIIARRRHAF